MKIISVKSRGVLVDAEASEKTADAAASDVGELSSEVQIMRWMLGTLLAVVITVFGLPGGVSGADTTALKPLARGVLDARTTDADATLADLYDPDLMGPNLRKAHHALDRAVDRLYRRQRFASKREGMKRLFALYERMQAPWLAAPG